MQLVVKTEKSVEEMRHQKIRRHFDGKNQKWYFSVVDVIAVLTETADARNYWKVLKNRLKKTQNELVTKCNQLKMMAKDGKFYLTDVADSETMIGIIKSIPKTSAEAFKVLMSEIEEIQENAPTLSEVGVPTPLGVGKENIEEDEAKLLVDVYEKDSFIWVEAMIAGVSLAELSITIFNKQIIIQGRREKIESEEEQNSKEEYLKEYQKEYQKEYLFQEICWTSFSRTVLLPCRVQKENAEATEENGHLKIKLAKI